MSHLGYRVHQRINNSGLGSNKTPNQTVGSIKSWSKLRILKNRNSSSSRSWVIWICNFCTSRRIPALSHVHFFARNAVLRDSQCTKRCVFQPHLRSGKSKVGRVMGCQWLVHARIILGSVSDQSPNSSDVSWVFHHIPRTDGFAYSYRVLHGRLALQDSILRDVSKNCFKFCFFREVRMKCVFERQLVHEIILWLFTKKRVYLVSGIKSFWCKV